MQILKKKNFTVFYLFLFLLITINLSARNSSELKNLLRENDSILLMDYKGKELVSINSDKKLVPASILKLLTSLSSIHYLGENYRFNTEFYIDKDTNDLIVKGYGDPLLISELFPDLIKNLKKKLKNYSSINNIILDHSYFNQPIKIPGVTKNSDEPYDAPNGAVCVNFNTVFFKQSNGKYISGEHQTPLLPFVKNRIKKSGLKQGRITLFKEDSALYAGHILSFFLKKEGIRVKGIIKTAIKNKKCKLVYNHFSKFKLTELVQKLLLFSNNFMANQIFISTGAKEYSSPGNIEKGIKAVKNYAKKKLQLENFAVVEGSGISRKNKISAKQMMVILNEFKKYYTLLRYESGEYYKTGTLKGISTRSGYLKNDKLFSYTVMLNSSPEKMNRVMRELKNIITNE